MQKYNMKWMIFVSLIASGIVNLIIAVSTNFAIIKWLWLINGFALSILWPTLIRLLSESMPQEDLATSSVVMGTTVATGTLIIYGLSSVFTFFNRFKVSISRSIVSTAFFKSSIFKQFSAVLELIIFIFLTKTILRTVTTT